MDLVRCGFGFGYSWVQIRYSMYMYACKAICIGLYMYNIARYMYLYMKVKVLIQSVSNCICMYVHEHRKMYMCDCDSDDNKYIVCIDCIQVVRWHKAIYKYICMYVMFLFLKMMMVKLNLQVWNIGIYICLWIKCNVRGLHMYEIGGR